MKIVTVEQNTDEWLELRKGKITGSKLKDIYAARKTTGKKRGFYQLIADKIAIDAELEDAREGIHAHIYRVEEIHAYNRAFCCCWLPQQMLRDVLG